MDGGRPQSGVYWREGQSGGCGAGGEEGWGRGQSGAWGWNRESGGEGGSERLVRSWLEWTGGPGGEC